MIPQLLHSENLAYDEAQSFTFASLRWAGVSDGLATYLHFALLSMAWKAHSCLWRLQ